ncbi:MAG: hypothetical protein ACLUE6_05025 [Acutalibacteraceae bacterium]
MTDKLLIVSIDFKVAKPIRPLPRSDAATHRPLTLVQPLSPDAKKNALFSPAS